MLPANKKPKDDTKGTIPMKTPEERTETARNPSFCHFLVMNLLKTIPVRRVATQLPSPLPVQMKLICPMATPTSCARYGCVGPRIPMARPWQM